jgi:hypothetical protein
MEHKKYLPDSMMLTKEAFEQHMLRLREERAKQYGMTLEQWDNAIASGSVVQTLNPNTPPSNNSSND